MAHHNQPEHDASFSETEKVGGEFSSWHGAPPKGRPTGPGKSKLDPYRPEIESLLVLDITDLAENKIDPDEFFAENYLR
jgi:hypothetical protein